MPLLSRAGALLGDLTRALKHRDFRYYATGQLVSLVGTWMQAAAMSWLVYRLTGSSAQLGLVGFAGQFPVFALSLLGGAAADLVDKRKFLVITQTAAMLQATALAALTLSGVVHIWHLLALAALLGTINALDMPLRQSFIIDLVDRKDLHNAIALNSSMFNAARILGPSVAGLLVAAVGEGVCFLVNAVSFAAVIYCLLRIRADVSPPKPRQTRFLAHLLEGVTHAARMPAVRSLLLLIGASSLLGVSSMVLMPVFAGEVFHGGPGAMGLLMASSGAGSLFGALALAARHSTEGLTPWMAKTSATFAVGLLLFSAAPSLWLGMAIMVPTGFGMVAFMAGANTSLQVLVPDRLRGRIMSLFSMMVIGMAPFGALLSGTLAEFLGPRGAMALSGAGCLLATGLFALGAWRKGKGKVEGKSEENPL